MNPSRPTKIGAKFLPLITVWWIRNSPPNSVPSLRAKRSNLDERTPYLPEIASSAYGLLAMP
jgi:hypothetical protein